ncbi:MAG TPA: Hpt domain-containing protein [Candidatus Binataceae bacterium]|jgi:HPt (histidine-containing phosphotransfer) domain-containing protein|nr:Hpt domain-containing protein [Candidatus Binataceae bacterium]
MREVAPENRGPVSFARIDRLRDSMRGKESLIDELIDLFAADLPKRLSAIAKAIEHDDLSALALQAHALRGGAANFGADRLDELCSMLEEIGRHGPHAEASAIFSQLRAESVRVRDALAALRSQPSQAPPAVQKSSGNSR